MALTILITAIGLYAYRLYAAKPAVSREVLWLRKSIETADSRRLI